MYERNYVEKRCKDMYNSIGIITYEKLCLESPSQASFISLMKKNIS